LLKLVGIPAPESRPKDYPFQMPGGMQQHVMIAMALSSKPMLERGRVFNTALEKGLTPGLRHPARPEAKHPAPAAKPPDRGSSPRRIEVGSQKRFGFVR